MPAADALADPGVLALQPVLAFAGSTAVRLRGGICVLPWRGEAVAAVGEGLRAIPDALEAGGGWDQVVVHVEKGRSATQASLAAAWQACVPGGRLLVCGDNDLGVATVLERLALELGRELTLVANRGRGRIGMIERFAHPGPARPPDLPVPLPDGTPLQVGPGVFAREGLDRGTAALLAQLARCDGQPPRQVLDLGCGAGHLAIAALLRWPGCRAVLADADHRAVRSAIANLAALGLAERARVRWWDAHEPLDQCDVDLALVNPPFHRGTAVDLGPARAMFRALDGALAPKARVLLVANRTLPYEHDLGRLGQIRMLAQEGGFKVVEVEHG